MVAEAILDRPAYQLTPDVHLGMAILSDWPLRYVCLAHQLFWT